MEVAPKYTKQNSFWRNKRIFALFLFIFDDCQFFLSFSEGVSMVKMLRTLFDKVIGSVKGVKNKVNYFNLLFF